MRKLGVGHGAAGAFVAVACATPSAFAFDVDGVHSGMSMVAARQVLTGKRGYKETAVKGMDGFFYHEQGMPKGTFIASIAGCEGKLTAVTLYFYPATLATLNRLIHQNNTAFGDSTTVSSSDTQTQSGEIGQTTITWADGDERVTVGSMTSKGSALLATSYYASAGNCGTK